MENPVAHKHTTNFAAIERLKHGVGALRSGVDMIKSGKKTADHVRGIFLPKPVKEEAKPCSSRRHRSSAAITQESINKRRGFW